MERSCDGAVQWSSSDVLSLKDLERCLLQWLDCNWCVFESKGGCDSSCYTIHIEDSRLIVSLPYSMTQTPSNSKEGNTSSIIWIWVSWFLDNFILCRVGQEPVGTLTFILFMWLLQYSNARFVLNLNWWSGLQSSSGMEMENQNWTGMGH